MKTIFKIILFIALVSITSAYTMEDFNFALQNFNQEVEEKFMEEKTEEEDRQWKIVVGTSFYTDHLKTDGMFEKNNLKQYGIEYKDWTVSYNGFINSFEQESHMIMIDKKTFLKETNFYWKAGLGIVKGYKKEGRYINKEKTWEENGQIHHWFEYTDYNNKFVFYKDYGLMGTVGVGYRALEHFDLEVNLFGEAIIMGVKVRM